MNKYLPTAIMAVLYGILAAGPLAMQDNSWKVVLWSGIIAAATYIKGKLEQAP